ncbi:hypothetical protein HHL25_05835 [Rhizobium sp. S-51]|uniref:Uncharacterized protein n=1 Tax=Rhizobium terricola TaxID=2728849 RepID=A0A7Y0AUA4_9HYPH|nr:hypothetical protein [Rhizobium terricola]NML73645.1 hypothetical protein [Rhizobium terricola]
MESCSSFWSLLIKLQEVSWLDWAKTLVDLLKGIAWPLAVFCLIWIFRKQIREKIPHLRNISPTSADFEMQPTSQATPGPFVAGPHRLSTVNDLVEKIQQELTPIIAESREPLLVRALAEARVLADFEFIFANIFKTQVDALRRLSEGSVSLEEAEKYFEDNVIPIRPELFAEWGFERWSAYLRSQGLVLLIDERVEITAKGNDFLQFVDSRKAGATLVN